MDTTTIDDIEIKFAPPKEAGEILNEGPYVAKLVGFKITDKPQWAIDNEIKKYPKKTIDPQQWEWRFQLTEEGYDDIVITDWTSPTFGTQDSPHKAKARIYAALLLGKSDLDGTEGMSTRQLIGKLVELWLVEGEKRNFIDASRSRPIATKPTRPQRVQNDPGDTPAVKQVQVPQLATPDDFWPEDELTPTA